MASAFEGSPWRRIESTSAAAFADGAAAPCGAARDEAGDIVIRLCAP
jgi:hypothetical protein